MTRRVRSSAFCVGILHDGDGGEGEGSLEGEEGVRGWRGNGVEIIIIEKHV